VRRLVAPLQCFPTEILSVGPVLLCWVWGLGSRIFCDFGMMGSISANAREARLVAPLGCFLPDSLSLGLVLCSAPLQDLL